ncbi:MAG: calcium/sodium antiporter [Planctomycetes bacterium]|nr:calcium/sodium antiporter [Planctomycetota bacterium]
MEFLIIGLQLVGGLAVLTLGADWLVKGSSNFALSVGVKPLVIGLTLVAFGTSTPELVVSVKGAVDGNAGISLGNVIGSNICNIGLILGLCAMIKPLDVSADMFRRDIPIMLLASVLLAVLPFIGGPTVVGDSVGYELSRWKAGVFLFVFVVSLWLTFRNAGGANLEIKPEETKTKRHAVNLGLALLGLVGLIAGGYFFVEGAVTLAQKLGIPALVIGLTIVAVGTSLPEFATSLIASMRGQADISVGNIVGSNIFNILLILGVAGLIAPLTIESKVLQLDIPVMIAMALLLPLLSWKSRQLGRLGGAAMFTFYVAYSLNLFFNWV